MRKELFALFGFFILFWTGETVATAQKPVTLTGKIANPNSIEVELTYTSNYLTNATKTFTKTLNSNGRFTFEFELQRPVEATLFDGKEYVTLFIEPKDKFDLQLNTEQFDESLRFSGKRGAENNTFMIAYFLQFEDYDEGTFFDLETIAYSAHPEQFVHKVDSLKTARLNFLENYNRRNKLSNVFETYIREKIRYQDALYRLSFGAFYSYYDEELPPDYYDFLQTLNPNTELPFLSTDYINFLHQYIPQTFENNNEDENLTAIEHQTQLYYYTRQTLNGMAADLISGIILLNIVENEFDIAYKPIYEHYMANCTMPPYKQIIQQPYHNILRTAPGSEAPGFSLTSRRGQQVTLADFRGKVVLLNFWASWNRVCLSNIELLKELHNHYEVNPDFVLINVSLDEDMKTMQSAITKFETPGIHLIKAHDTDTDIGAHYNIDVLPHYLLIDKKGIIIANPIKDIENQEKLRHTIDNLLKTN